MSITSEEPISWKFAGAAVSQSAGSLLGLHWLWLSTQIYSSGLKSYGLGYNLTKIPTSTKGYTLGARTAMRFKPVNKKHPSPDDFTTCSSPTRLQTQLTSKRELTSSTSFPMSSSPLMFDAQYQL
ncbi:uncharacterized protein LOC144368244 [Ictidomys tridecemlineatus]